MTLKPHDLSQPQTTVHTPRWFVCSQRQKSYPNVAGKATSVNFCSCYEWSHTWTISSSLSITSCRCFLSVFLVNAIVDAQIDQKYPHQIFMNFFTNFYELPNYGSMTSVKNNHTSTWLVIMWTLRHITTISFCLSLHRTYTCVHTYFHTHQYSS